MRVCILSDEAIEDYNPSVFFRAHEWDFFTVTPPVSDFIRQVVEQKNYDVFLNICEGADDNDADSGFSVVQTLESLGVPFTGADSKFYNPTREQMQTAAEARGLNFARGFNARSVQDLSQAHALRFPLIVKHPNSFGSAGLTPHSRVDSFEELEEQFQRNFSEYGSARVEEFIEGREVSCLVADNPDDLANPFAYLPVEVKFPVGETFMHMEVKWLNWDTFIVPLEGEGLVRSVQEVSRQMFQVMGGTGYARVDIRVRPNGELVILEINPNCGILYYGPDDRSMSDLPISWDKDGHDGFLDRIFRSAILRRDLRSGREK
ncbi:MAG TPA: hypothetical protein PLF18_02940 [Anaerolineales bacterium]|nr:hypothetical protein [Anaerolineales bacterium]HNH03676.1 hypothetical protein [Anaerolineales bacterium]